jgi:hypothetical protein
MLAGIFIGALIVGVFAYEMLSLWWRQTAWRRRWRDRDADQEE